MRCDELKTLLYQAADPRDLLSEAAEAHLRQCPKCQALRDDLLAMCGSMANMAGEELPEGFSFSLHRKLKQVEAEVDLAAMSRRKTTKNNRPPLALALAASLLIVAGLGWWLLKTPPTIAPSGDINKIYVQLQISIDSRAELNDADLDIILPPGLDILAETGLRLDEQRILRLRSNLRQGTNQIALPLASVGAAGAIETKLTVQGQTIVRKVAVPMPTKAAKLHHQKMIEPMVMISLHVPVSRKEARP